MATNAWGRTFFLVLLAFFASPSVRMDPDPPTEARYLWARELERLQTQLAVLPSDLEKTTFLRRYTGALTDIGRLDRRTRQFYGSVDFDSLDPAALYPIFAANELPADCGITSLFYIKLLHSFGFKAYQYSFGFTEKPYDRFIHSVALVEIGSGGGTRLIVQDPYLNLTYRGTDGAPLDFFDLLDAIEERRYDRIVMDASSVTTALLVPDTALYYPFLSAPCRARMAAALTRPDGSIATEIPIAREYSILMTSPCDDFEGKFAEALRQNGFDEPFLFAYSLRASEMVGSADVAQVQSRIGSSVR